MSDLTSRLDQPGGVTCYGQPDEEESTVELNQAKDSTWRSVKEALPLVTVVTPIRNAARFLSETIESVLAQTYTRWELLLVDDGSDDGSGAIARAYAAEHPDRIRALSQPNAQRHCAGAARNVGVRHARGSLLCFLDADDVWRPEKLAYQVREMRDHPDAAALYGRTVYWSSWSPDAAVPDDNPPLGVPSGHTIAPPELFLRCLTGLAAVPCPCSFMVRTEAVTAIDAWDDEFASIYDDQVFFSKLFLSYPVYISTGCLDYYRQHPDSWCHQTAASGRLADERVAYLERLRAHIASHWGNDARLARAVEQELHYCRNPRRFRRLNLERYVTRKVRWLWLRFADRSTVAGHRVRSGQGR
jgi:glycosyltransferase involved in cell wall biosynthesis